MAFVFRFGGNAPSSDYSEPGDIGLDADGNLAIVGTFSNTFTYGPPPGQVPLTSNGDFAAFVVRVDPLGMAIRSDAFPVSLPEFNAERYALAGNGEDYILGLFEETITFDAGPPAIALTSAGHGDVFLLRMDSNGDPEAAYRWGTPAVSGGGPADRAAGLAVDGTDVYVGINFAPVFGLDGTIDADPGPGVENYVADGFDGLIVKLDGDGNFIRALHLAGNGSDQITDLEVDPAGDLVVTGQFTGTIDLDPGPGADPFTAAGTDGFLVKFDSDGNLVWTGAFTGAGTERLTSIAIDADGNIYGVGTFTGTIDADPGPGVSALTADGALDEFLVKVDPDGDLVWARALGGPGFGLDLREVVIDSEGNAIVVGAFSGTVDFDPAGSPTPLTSAGGTDALVAKYDPDGMLVWARRHGGAGEEGARDAAVGPGDAVNVVGLFAPPTFDWDPGPGTVVLTSLGSSDSFLIRITSDGNLVTDLTPPTITSIDSTTADGLYGIGASIDVTVNFSEEVTLAGGNLTITLDTGDVVTIAPFTGMSASGTYSVGLGDVSADLDSTALARAGGASIEDSSGNALAGLTPATDLGDNRDIVIDGIPPAVSDPDLAPASDSGAANDDDLTFDTTPEFIGTAEIGATVVLMEGVTTLGTDVADGSGNWSITPGVALPAGSHTVFAVATDAAGNDATSGTLVIEIDTVTAVSDPDLTAASDSGSSSTDNVTNDTTPTFTGTGEVGATVRLVEGVTTLGTDVVDGSGNWEITWSGAPEGLHLLFAEASDLAGNSDESNLLTIRIDTTAPDTLIDSGPPSPTGDTTADFDFGSDETPVTFAANLNGGPFGPVGELHSVSTPADGIYTLAVRATDLAGNTDATPAVHVWEVDALPPLPPVIMSFSTDTGILGDRVTMDQTLVIAGTAEANTLVRLFLPGLGEVGTAMADGGGAWSIGPLASLPEGVYPFTATATDGFDRESDPSAPFQVLIDLAGNPTNGPDIVAGNDQANQIQGLNGNDTIFGLGGNDTLKGNNGDDWLDGGDGSDRLEGENGNDVLHGQNGNDSLYGLNGNDVAEGGAGNDRLEGGAGTDSLAGGAGADTMLGGTGADRLDGGLGADRYLGEADGDWLVLGADGVRDSVMGTIAHLSGDTIDGFVGGAPTSPAADLLLIQGLTIAQAKKLDGQDVGDGTLDLGPVGGGIVTFQGLTGGATLDTVLGGGGEILIYVV